MTLRRGGPMTLRTGIPTRDFKLRDLERAIIAHALPVFGGNKTTAVFATQLAE